MPYTAVQSHSEEDSSSTEKTHLHRGLSPLMNFAFGFTEVGVLSSICMVFGHGLSLGGTATFFWTYFVNFILTIITGYVCAYMYMYVIYVQSSYDTSSSADHYILNGRRYSMAELCAAYPSAGACYQVNYPFLHNFVISAEAFIPSLSVGGTGYSSRASAAHGGKHNLFFFYF